MSLVLEFRFGKKDISWLIHPQFTKTKMRVTKFHQEKPRQAQGENEEREQKDEMKYGPVDSFPTSSNASVLLKERWEALLILLPLIPLSVAAFIPLRAVH